MKFRVKIMKLGVKIMELDVKIKNHRFFKLQRQVRVGCISKENVEDKDGVPNEWGARQDESNEDAAHHAKSGEESVSVAPASKDTVFGQEHDGEEEEGTKAGTRAHIGGEGGEGLCGRASSGGRAAFDVKDHRAHNDESGGEDVGRRVEVERRH